jgi:chaperonin GroEL (HSP60 family)
MEPVGKDSLVSSKYVNNKQHSILLRNGCLMLLNLSSSSFGPHGSFKVMKANSAVEGVKISSISSEIFSLSNLTRMSPVLKMVIQLFANQVNIYGDSGHFFIQFCCSLITKGLDIIDQSVPRRVCITVYRYLLEKIENYLKHPSCPIKKQVSIKDMQTIRHIVRNIIVTKNISKMSPEESNYISTIILQAVLQSLVAVPGRNNGDFTSSVRCIEVPGQPVNKSMTLDNTVIMDLPIDTRVKIFIEKKYPQVKCIENIDINDNVAHSKNDATTHPLKIIVFDMALTYTLLPKTSSYFLNYTTVIDSSKDAHSNHFEKRKENANIEVNNPVELFLKHILDNHIDVIFSQKTIDSKLQDIFIKNNIIPVERLSIKHIKAIASISGATVLSDNHINVTNNDNNGNSFYSNAIGEINNINMIDIYNERYLMIKGYEEHKRNRPISTLILCSHSEHSVNELTRNVKRAIKVINRFFHSPYVVPGAGAFEYLISNVLSNLDVCKDLSFLHSLSVSFNSGTSKDEVGKLKRQVRLCKENMVKSFHTIIVNLFGERSKMINLEELLHELKRNNIDNNRCNIFHKRKYYGCNVEFNQNAHPLVYTRKIFSMNNTDTDDVKDIMDVYVTKVEALRSAVEIACIILRTNGTIFV